MYCPILFKSTPLDRLARAYIIPRGKDHGMSKEFAPEILCRFLDKERIDPSAAKSRPRESVIKVHFSLLHVQPDIDLSDVTFTGRSI